MGAIVSLLFFTKYCFFYKNSQYILNILSIPFWEWWCPLGCVHWWWCQTWCLHHLAQWCTLLRHFSRCPSHGLWFYRQQTPLQKTQGLLGERNLSTNKHQTSLRLIRYLHLTSDGKHWALHILCPLCSLSPTRGSLIYPQASGGCARSEVSPAAIGMTLFYFDVFGHQGFSALCNWLNLYDQQTQELKGFDTPNTRDQTLEEIYKQTAGWLIITYIWK